MPPIYNERSFKMVRKVLVNQTSLLALSLTAWAVLSAQAAQATVIDTTAHKDQDSPSMVSGIDEATIGQTFTVGNNNVLQGFTFWVGGHFNGEAPLKFTAYVMAWDGSSATGEVLYQSTQRTKSTGAQFERFDFSTGLILEPGRQYIAFIQVDDLGSSTTGASLKASPSLDPYAEGQVVSRVGYSSEGAWTQYGGQDAAFLANFTSSAAVTGGASGVAAGIAALGAAVGTGLPASNGAGSSPAHASPTNDQPAQPAVVDRSVASTQSPLEVPEQTDQPNTSPPPSSDQPAETVEDLGNSPATVPTPALLPGLVGLGIGVLRKPRTESKPSATDQPED